MGLIWVPWLVDAARMTGYPVVEVPGWRSRGRAGMRLVEGLVAHHTAGAPGGEYPSLGIVTHGRAGLAGPLSAFGLGRSGTVYVIGAGISNHAGASTWAGFRDLNDEFLGCEAESAGSRDDWTPAQRDCYPRLAAAILFYLRRGADRVGGHKEVCLPRGRKPDPAFWDMETFRAGVAWMLADPHRRIPRGGTVPPPISEDSVALERFVPTDIPPPPQGGGRWEDTDPRTWPASREEYLPLVPPAADNWRGLGSISSLTCGWPKGYVHYLRVFHDRDGSQEGPPLVTDLVPEPGVELAPHWKMRRMGLPPWSFWLLIKYAAPGGLGIGIEYQH
ncbi:MAG: N-acetylmuramoyl-L-alanine amidase [Pseudonocardiaceae bacterium]